MFQLIIELSGIAIALVLGLYTFRYMTLLHKFFFYQLLAFITVYILSYMVFLLPNSSGLHHNNQWLFNISMPIETGLLTWAAFEYFKMYKERFLIWIAYTIFLAIFISELFIKGVLVFSNHGYITQSILLEIMYLLIMYVRFRKQSISWWRSPEVWISLGIVLYFGGIVPYLGLIHYLQLNHPKINLFLYRFIIEGLGNLRYIFLAVGFWLIRRNAITQTSAVHE